MKNISILGLGNISIEVCSSLKEQGFNIYGSTDNSDRRKALQQLGVKIFSRNKLNECILKADKIIITIPPDLDGCPVIRYFSKEILESNIKWIGYLSSTSVYGNYNGKIVNVDNFTKKGDVVLYSSKTHHGVMDIDPESFPDLSSSKGRYVALTTLFKW